MPSTLERFIDISKRFARPAVKIMTLEELFLALILPKKYTRYSF